MRVGDLRLPDPQQLNYYSYVANNPLKYKDPSGESAACAAIAPGVFRRVCEVAVGLLGAMAGALAQMAASAAAINLGVAALVGYENVPAGAGEHQSGGRGNFTGQQETNEFSDEIKESKTGGGGGPGVGNKANKEPENNSNGGDGTVNVPKVPKTSPGEEWEWKGTGPPGSNKGAWYNPETGESLHPDLNHGPPHGPHWDYKAGKNSGTSRVPPEGGVPVPKDN